MLKTNLLGTAEVTHWNRIRKVPSSNPGAGQPDWGRGGVSLFPSVMNAKVGLDFHYHDRFDHYS